MSQHSPSSPFFNLSAALFYLALEQALAYMTGILEAPETPKAAKK